MYPDGDTATALTIAAPQPGRPRSEGCRQKILAAADALLARDGFARMSMEAIAHEAGSSKATIYRWWPNKAAVVMDAVLESTAAEIFVPAGPDPQADLQEKLVRTIALFRGPKGRVFASLIAESQFDPELAEAYRVNLLIPRRVALRGVLERMIEAGQLNRGTHLVVAMDMLLSPIYARLLLGHAALDDEFARDYPRLALAALRGLGDCEKAA
jgi:AcrR family transcriptional regulator